MNLHPILCKIRTISGKARNIKLIKNRCMVLGAGIIVGAGSNRFEGRKDCNAKCHEYRRVQSTC